MNMRCVLEGKGKERCWHVEGTGSRYEYPADGLHCGKVCQARGGVESATLELKGETHGGPRCQ